MSFPDEEIFEHTLLVVREVSVYKIPPRSSSGGYKCGEWLQSDRIWTGRLRVVSIGELCEIRLEDSNTGELFAACHVPPGKRDICVEPAVDSSRYFVLRIDDGHGKHAFIGLGFTERNEAFDFNVALSDHEKHVLHRQKEESEEDSKAQESASSLDLRLKEGETIRINVKTKTTTSTSAVTMSNTSSGANAAAGRMKASLAPPPGAVRVPSPLPPPPNDTKNQRVTRTTMSGLQGASLESKQPNDGAFTDLSKLGLSLPSGTPSNKNSNVGGWAAF